MQNLPLTLFERYLYHDDRPDRPCWILVRCRFSGTLRRDVLEWAWEQVAARHPLLAARVERSRSGRLRWLTAAGERAPIGWRSGGWDWPELPPIDLTKEPGFRLSVAERPGSAVVFCQAHHAVLDGSALFAVLDDLLVHYAIELGADVSPKEIRPEDLPRRNGFGLSAWDRLKLAPAQALGLALSLEIHSRRATPLGAAAPDRPAAANAPNLARRRLSRADFERLRAAGRALGAGMYEILIRDFQAALGGWLKDQAGFDPSSWIHLVLPIHLRRPADDALPAANVVSLVVFDRRAKSLLDRDRLLRRAQEDLGWVKRRRFGYVFLAMLWLRRLLPGGIRGYCRRPVCRASALLTNLGQLFSTSPLARDDGRVAVPGAVLEEVSLAAPLRPGLGAALAVGVYGGELWIDLSYDPGMLDRDRAEALASAFVDHLSLTMESG